MPFTDIIRAKRDGRALDDAQIGRFVAGLADGSLPGEQIAALAMAILLKGMDAGETAALTRAMTASGEILDWSGERLPGPLLDKHSTGGVGDKVSLMLAPIVAACGGVVPMISGRGLGHTGGTLDKLSSIPGYDVFPGLDRFRQVVREAGCAIIGQTGELAPADRRLYAVRDISATIESLPLITASILSKKLAAGVDGLVMDIKIGSGAFMATEADARALSDTMSATAAALGLGMRSLITDMNQILGHSAGNALEIAETVAYLRGDAREPRLHTVVIALAGEMLQLGGLADSAARGREQAEAVLASGAAAERFQRMVHGLGGPGDLVERADHHLPQAAYTAPVLPEHEGYLAAIDGKAVGEAIIDLGGGRRRIEDRIDPTVGFTACAAIGDPVGPDRPLAIVHAADAEAARRGVAQFRAACIVAASPVPPVPAIYGGDPALWG